MPIYMQTDLTSEQIKLINIVERFFCRPVDAQSNVMFTTAELYGKLQSIFPSPEYTAEDVYHVLTYMKFGWIHSTDNCIYWFVQQVGSE